MAIGGNSYRFHLFEEKEVGSSRINIKYVVLRINRPCGPYMSSTYV